MSHVVRIVKAFFIRKKLSRYKRAQEMAYELEKSRHPKTSFFDKLYYWWSKYLACGILKASIRANLNNERVLSIARIYAKTFTDGTYHNFVAKAVAGFIGGIFCTWFIFAIFVSPFVDYNVDSAFYITCFLSFVFTLGLAFSESTRCIVITTLPQFCTETGRRAIIAYMYILMLSGPVRNTVYNVHNFQESIACTQAQIRHAIKLILVPLREFAKFASSALKYVKVKLKPIREVLRAVKESIESLCKTVKKAYDWLRGNVLTCNNQAGTPYERCFRYMRYFNDNCRAFMGRTLWGVGKAFCGLLEIVTNICTPFKAFDFLCNITSKFVHYLKETIFDGLKEKLVDLGRNIKTMFYVKVSISHSYDFESNQTKTQQQVAKEVYEDMQDRLSFFLNIFQTFRLVLTPYLFYVMIGALTYRYRFFNYDWYDNHYVNNHFIELDIRRASKNRETLLPLTFQERLSYVSGWSFRLSIQELKSFLKDSKFMLRSSIWVGVHLSLDYGVYWVVYLVRRISKYRFYIKPAETDVGVEGGGFLREIFQALGDCLKSVNKVEDYFLPCVPDPISPDYNLYAKILYLLAVTWIMAILQPFGLRFRNFAMSYYYREAARRRAVWLYNNIKQKRGTFSTFLRRRFGPASKAGIILERPSILQWLEYRFWFLRLCLPRRRNLCLICGSRGEVQCETPDCRGFYCHICYKDIDNTCVICNISENFGDDGISEEEDSTEDEIEEHQSTVKSKTCITSANVDVEKGILEMERAREQIIGRKMRLSIKRHKTRRNYFSNERRCDWASVEDYNVKLPKITAACWVPTNFRKKYC